MTMQRLTNDRSRRLAQVLDRLIQRADLLYASKALVWMTIGLGILLRVAQYLANRSLWVDEAFVALDVVQLSIPEFLQATLRTGVTAPLGFLVLVELAVQALGPSEYVLRLFPLVCGIASLPLFYWVARHYISPKAVPIALGLFAISEWLIYQASELKPYSSDVAIGLLLYSVTIYVQAKKLTLSRMALLIVLGAVAVWFSYPAVFILAGVGGSLILFCIAERDWAKVARLLVVVVFWVSSFVVNYVFYSRSFSDHELNVAYFGSSALPFPPLSVSDLTQTIRIFFARFERPGGFALPGIAAFAFLVGCFSMLSRKRGAVLILLSPLFVAAVASGLGKYPFVARLLLFAVPFVLLFVAEGVQKVVAVTKREGALIGIVLVALLFYHPLYQASYHLITPRTNEEIRPVVGYLAEHKLDTDVLYLYHASEYAFRYYTEVYGFDNGDYILGAVADDWAEIIDDMSKLRGNERVWLLFSHTVEPEKERCYLAYLDNIGTRLDSFQRTGASLYLYDLAGN
jgi:hypothetical protein